MKAFRIFGILSLGLMAFSHPTQTTAPADDFCGLKNTSFQSSEQISYIVVLQCSWYFVNAGTANFYRHA